MSDSAQAPQASLEERVRILEAQLRQTQKMAALGELASTTTHEFNNALTTIINYAKLGLRHKDEATRDKAFDRMLTAARRAERITSSVLGFSRNRATDFEATDLSKVIEDTLVLLEREMHRYHVRVETKIEEAPPVRAVRNQIQQVLLNLLTNARQSMVRGGTIIIRLQDNPEEGSVDLTIRDTGCGIPQQKLPRIFDRFYSTKDGPDATGKGGTGVGLSTCRDIIQAHSGRIRVESTVGRGTAFIIKLPAMKALQETADTPPIPQLGVPGVAAASDTTT